MRNVKHPAWQKFKQNGKEAFLNQSLILFKYIGVLALKQADADLAFFLLYLLKNNIKKISHPRYF